MQLILFIFLFWYGWVMLRRLVAWQNMAPVQVPPGFLPQTRLSVIIPVRNEGPNIALLLQDLKNQEYPAHLLEVLVVDDHSEDDSAALVNYWRPRLPFFLQCLTLQNRTGKKAAVQVGVTAATGTLLVFTDGDCRVPPTWLRYLAYVFETYQPQFISGPVVFSPTPTLFEKMQMVEFASLIGTGGSSIALGQPNMCNGANLAYPKTIFKQVNGFAGNEHLPSGDDEFLMHKVHARQPGSVFFLKALEATVVTRAKPTLSSFFAQRVRWASKWPAYQPTSVKILALLVFGLNLLVFMAAGLVVGGLLPISTLAVTWLLKFLIDFFFLQTVLKFFNKLKYAYIILPLQLLYVPYVVITALVALRGAYTWKGRKIKPGH